MSEAKFEWTDTLVGEFIGFIMTKYEQGASCSEAISAFKASKQPIRDWEILTLKNKSGTLASYDTGEIGTYNKPLSEIYKTREHFVECFLNFPEWKIHSVKRSDGCVFTVGEEVDSTWKRQVIERFFIDDLNDMVAEFESCRNPLSKLQKVQPKPVLFTTVDGVSITEFGTKCFLVKEDRNFSIDTYEYHSHYANYPTWKLFSTRDAAKEYIHTNKPCLSVADIAGLWCIEKETREALKELAKKKQNV